MLLGAYLSLLHNAPFSHVSRARSAHVLFSETAGEIHALPQRERARVSSESLALVFLAN